MSRGTREGNVLEETAQTLSDYPLLALSKEKWENGELANEGRMRALSVRE
jgi:hypothetical protein